MQQKIQLDKAALIAALAKKNLRQRGAEPGCTPCAFCNTQCVPSA